MEQNIPFVNRQMDNPAVLMTCLAASRLAHGLTEGIDASIGRVLQNVQNSTDSRRLPHDVVGSRPAQRPGRQQQLFPPAIADHSAACAQLLELAKNEVQARLHLFVGIHDHLTVR
jgi:hypothetical protein